MSELRAPHSAKEYLSEHYSAELRILRHVALDSERYGAAYLHYTRYRILSWIAGTLGLHLSKPSQPSTIHGLTFTYNDLIQWAEVNSGTFGNLKTLLACTDNLRARLNRSASATTDRQRAVLLTQLNALATDPFPGIQRSNPMTWTIADLRRKLSICDPVVRPSGLRCVVSLGVLRLLMKSIKDSVNLARPA